MEVTFYPSKQKEGKIVAFADVVVAEGIIVRGFRIVDGSNGMFACVPSRSYTLDGKPRFANQVRFSTQEIRDRFLSDLLECFYRWYESQTGAESDAGKGLSDGENQTNSAAPPF